MHQGIERGERDSSSRRFSRQQQSGKARGFRGVEFCSDLERPVTREFCPECGTHLSTAVPGMPAALLKVGTLDDPSLFGGPDMVIFTMDKQGYHQLPEGVPHFERGPN